jgi:hypothetical protein
MIDPTVPYFMWKRGRKKEKIPEAGGEDEKNRT